METKFSIGDEVITISGEIGVIIKIYNSPAHFPYLVYFDSSDNKSWYPDFALKLYKEEKNKKEKEER